MCHFLKSTCHNSLMFLRKIIHKLNIKAQCKELGVSLWACPQFIFLIMGVFIITMILITYNVGQRYIDAQIVAIIVLFVTAFLFIISLIIIRAFEQVVESKKLEAKQAKEILKLKDHFVFIAAHELRTPANAIKWGLSSLREEQPELTEKGKELFDIIQRGNERLLSLVKDILEVARLESGTIKITLEKIVIVDSFGEACKEVQQLADEQKKTIDCNFQSDLPLVWGDKMRLKEVFGNLLSNAIKFGREGTDVSVSTEVNDTTVVFHITNKGSGLNSEEQKHLFEKFWRSKTAHDIEGTGLGLFITKQLLELMSGRIWFTSKRDEGTTFSFSLVRADAPSPQEVSK